MSLPPTAQEIRTVARKSVALLAEQGLSSCLFGSSGCSLYGCTRKPNDVDIIVMTTEYSTEELKELIAVQPNTRFYLRGSKTVGATYKVLFYSLGKKRSCKVDVLIPGVLNIPYISPDRIVHIDGLPVLPFIPLLLLKLQGWSDHRASAREDMRQKQYIDIRDLQQLLTIAAQKGENVGDVDQWLPASFMFAGRERIRRFVETYRQPEGWERIGFSVR